MSFKEFNLDSKVYKAVARCGYDTPTPVQEAAIPVILEGSDLIACAQTGTGKTAAFMLPLLTKFASEARSPKETYALILAPTRELAQQITEAAKNYGKFLSFNVVSLVGGVSYFHQNKDLTRGAQILVATPGRLIDYIKQKKVDLSKIKMLVLDEADRMLDMGFIEDVEYISKLMPAKKQTLLFSATVDEQIKRIIKKLMHNPKHLNLSQQSISAPRITQSFYKVDSMHEKTQLLVHLLKEKQVFKSIIFSATKANTDRLAKNLRNYGFSAAALHGDMKQNARNRTVTQLRQGKIQVLVATDVAARGIDIQDISHVINYDLPHFSEDYVHRIGRTGRAGKEGNAISFVSSIDHKHFVKIERYTGARYKLVRMQGVAALEAPMVTIEEPKKTTRKPFKSSPHKSSSIDEKPKKPWHKKKLTHGKPQQRSKGKKANSSSRNDSALRSKRSRTASECWSPSV